MARQARTKSVLSQLSGNTKLEVGSAKVNHAIKKHVSSMVGTDIMAGEATLSNAFNNFFGTMQNTMQNMAKSAHEIDKLEATRFADEQKKLGTIAGNKKAMGQTINTEYDAAGNVMDTKPTNAQRLKNFDVTESGSTNLHYNQAYKESVGSQLGADMYADMLIKSADWNPADFDSKASEWWKNNYADGAKDPTVNLHAQAAFQKNIVKLSAEKQIEVIKRNRAVIETQITDGVVTSFETESDLHNAYTQSMAKMKSIMPGQTNGAVSARVLSAMVKGARLNPNALKRFRVFLNKGIFPTTDDSGAMDEGARMQSLKERFPSQVSELLKTINKENQSYMTQQGSDAVTLATSKINQIVAATENDPDAMTSALQKFMKDEEGGYLKLASTNGVTTPQIKALRSSINKHLIKAATFKVNRSNLIQNGISGKSGSLTYDDAKTTLATMSLSPTTDFYQGDESSVAFAQVVRGAIKRYGVDVIGDDLKGKIKSGLLSNDKNIRRASLDFLKQIDPSEDLSEMKDGLFKGDVEFQASLAGVIKNANSNIDPTIDAAKIAQMKKEMDDKGGWLPAFYASEVSNDKDDYNSKNERQIMFQKWMAETLSDEVEGMVGEGGFFSFSDMPISSRLSARIEGYIEPIILDMKVNGTWNQTDSNKNRAIITEQIKLKLKDQIVFMNGQASIQEPGLVMHSNTTNTRVPIGNNVRNGSGGTEDVIMNMQEVATNITEGFPGLSIGGDIMIRPHKNFRIKAMFPTGNVLNGFEKEMTPDYIHGFAIYDSVNSSVPISLSTNVDIPVKEVSKIKEDGTYGGNFGWTEWQSEGTVKFTGVYSQDLILAQKYINPYIILMPVYSAVGGKIQSYELGVQPHFQNEDKKTISNEMLLKFIQNGKPQN